MTRPQFARRSHRSQDLLRDWTRAEPWRESLWRAIDVIRSERRDWPSAIYVPLEEVGEAVAAGQAAHGRQPTEATVVREACECQGLAAWRLTRGIYRYDPTLAEALRTTPLTGELPADILTRLPEWAVYIETPGETTPTNQGPLPLLGCLAWLDWVSAEARDEADWTPERSHYQLMLGLDLGGARYPVAAVPLMGTLDEAVATNQAQWEANRARYGVDGPRAGYADAARAQLPGLISRVLYLCSEDADLGGRRPGRPQPVRTKHGWRLFPAQKSTTWDVGVRLGAAIRRAQEGEHEAGSDTHVGPRPHIRRAHWHSFWTGPKAQPDKREIRVRWLPPIPVNVDDVEALPATIHQVRAPGLE